LTAVGIYGPEGGCGVRKAWIWNSILLSLLPSSNILLSKIFAICETSPGECMIGTCCTMRMGLSTGYCWDITSVCWI